MGLVGLLILLGPRGCHGCRGWMSNCRVNNAVGSVGAIVCHTFLEPRFSLTSDLRLFACIGELSQCWIAWPLSSIPRVTGRFICPFYSDEVPGLWGLPPGVACRDMTPQGTEIVSCSPMGHLLGLSSTMSRANTKIESYCVLSSPCLFSYLPNLLPLMMLCASLIRGLRLFPGLSIHTDFYSLGLLKVDTPLSVESGWSFVFSAWMLVAAHIVWFLHPSFSVQP